MRIKLRIKHCMLISVIAISVLPVISAAAEITISNNTNYSGTAKFTTPIGSSPCSSTAGDRGIAKPHASITVPQFVIDMYCRFGCQAPVYMTTNCSGSVVATASIDPQRGVTSITNHNINGYYATGGGTNVAINGGPSKKWYDFLF